MSAEIHQLPVSRRIHNLRVAAQQDRRNELAAYLRQLADYIQGDDVESEPTALMIVLSGKAGDEVVWKGYADNPQVSLRDAGHAAYRQVNTSYTMRGGNFHDRRRL